MVVVIEAFVAEVDLLNFFEIGFRQLLQAPCGGVGSCVRVDGIWADGIWADGIWADGIGLLLFQLPMVLLLLQSIVFPV